VGQDRIIFLDIDGVLATRPALTRAMPQHTGLGRNAASVMMRSFWPQQPRILRAQPIGFLNRVLQETGARMVVSSSWRLEGDPRPALCDAGVSGRFHEHWATDAYGPQRGDEIERWLAAHPAAQYVVLDDWSLGLERHAHRTVLTDFRIGLTGQKANAAVALLRVFCPTK